MNTKLRKVALGLVLGLSFLSAACSECIEGSSRMEINENATNDSERMVQMKCVNGEWVQADSVNANTVNSNQ